MLRKISLALAVSCASNGMAWAADAPLSARTDLVSVYQEAVNNNADLAAARAGFNAAVQRCTFDHLQRAD
jgi:outer membrane protein